MAATPGGGGGGRSFPVYIDLITRGADQAISGLNAVSAAAGKINTGARQASTSMDTVTKSSQTLNTASVAASQGLGRVDTATKSVAGTLPKATSGMLGISQATEQTGQAMNTASQSATNLNQRLGRASAGYQAFRNAGRGAQFAIIGLIGSVNEAVFMIERTIAANAKQEAAQARVNQMVEAGQTGTAEYSRATRDLEEAQRGAQFTSRIMAQSVLDNVTFMGMLGSQLPKVINEYNRLRAGSSALGATMTAQSGILSRLGGFFGITASNATQLGTSMSVLGNSTNAAGTQIASLANRTQPLAGALSNVSISAGQFRTQMANVATSTSAIPAALGNVGSQLSTLGPGFGRVAAQTTTLTGALGSITPAAAASTASLLPLSGSMTAVSTTSRSIVPSVGGASGALMTIPPAATAGTVALTGLAGAMARVGQAAWAFVTNPFGALIVAFAGIVTLLIALKDNWGGVTDALYEFGGAIAEAIPASRIQLGLLEGFANWLGILSKEERIAAEEAKNMAEQYNELADRIISAEAEMHGFGLSIEQVGSNVEAFLQETGNSVQQFGVTFTTVMDQVLDKAAEQPADQPLPQGLQNQIVALQNLAGQYNTTFGEIERIAADGSLSVNERLMTMISTADQVGVAMSNFPDFIQDAMGHAAEGFHSLVEAGELSEMQLMSIMGRLSQGIAVQLPVGFEQAVPGIQAAVDKISTFIQAIGKDSTAANMLNIRMLQMLGIEYRKLPEDVQQAMAANEDFIESLQKEADQLGLNIDVKQENIHQTIEAITAREREIATMKAVVAGLQSLNSESISMQDANETIIAGIQLQTQAFDENAVMLAAQAAGMQEWRDVQAEAYFDIVQTAEALGFQGEATKANVVAMLDHIAVTERQNEANTTAVEGYFSLSDSQRQTIDSSGQLAQTMGQVALGVQDVTSADAALIAEQVRLNDANQDAYESWLNLDEGQRIALESMGITAELMDQVRAGTITLDDAMIRLITTEAKVAEETDKHNEAISQLMPNLQRYAAQLQLVNQAGEQATLVEQAMLKSLQDAESGYESAIQGMVNYVAEHGNLNDIVGMSIVQIGEHILTMEESGTTAEEAAEKQKEAAEAIAEAWEEDLDRAIEAWNNASSVIGEAATNISDEIGDAGAEGAIAFTESFLNEFIPQQMVEEAFDKNMDLEDLIDDIRDEAEDNLKEGLITPVAMRESVQPMLDELENLEQEGGASMGDVMAILRSEIIKGGPAISGGIHHVGQDALSALDQGLLTPLQTMMSQGAGGPQMWQPMVDQFRAVVNSLPPEYANLRDDWLGTLNRVGGDTRTQVNTIMSILQEIAPGWHEEVMSMDTDGDGIINMFDRIDDAAVRTRDAIVDAAIISAEAVGNKGLAAQLDYLRDNFESLGYGATGATQPVVDFGSAVDTVGERLGLATEPTSSWLEWFNNLDEAAKPAAIEMYNSATAVEAVGTAADTAAPKLEEVPQATSNWGGITRTATEVATGVDTELGKIPESASTRSSEAAGNWTSVWGGHDWSAITTPINTALEATKESARAAGEVAGTAFMQGWGGGARTGGEAATGPGAFGTARYGQTGLLSQAPGAEEQTASVAEVVPPPDFTEAEQAWRTYETNVANTMTRMTTNVQAHTNMMTAHFAYHAQQVGAQVNITGQHLLRLVQGYNLTTMGVQQAMTLMAVSWVGHATMVGAQVDATGMHLLRLVQGYGLTLLGVQTAHTNMALSWLGHATTIGMYVDATGLHLLRLVQGYGLTMTGVATALTNMAILWVGHATAVGAQIGAINTHLGTLNGFIAATAGVVLTNTTNMSIYWSGHATSVGTSINSSINTHISSYHSMMTGLASQVHSQLENMNQNWSAHADHVGNMMSDMSGHVSDFASDFSDSMGDVISDANAAQGALESLKSSIDALQSKTITIRTNFVSSGTRTAAGGMNETVTGPTLILAGEAGAERVHITPHVGASNPFASSTSTGMGFLAAAKGMDKIVTPWDNKAVSTFAGERGHRVREIKDEMEDEDKMVVRVDKVYRGAKITKEEWNRFAKEYGMKVKDIDKKKYGHEVDFKMLKGVRPLAADSDEPEGFMGGIGDFDTGGRRGGFEDDFGGGGGGGGVGAGRALEAAGGLQRPARPGTGGGGTGGGGTGGTVTAGGGGGITKIVFNGPITVQTALDVTLEIDHQKFGKLSRQVVSEGYGHTK